MSGKRWLRCLFAALVAASFLMLPAAPSAHAQKRGAHGVNSSFNKAVGIRGIDRGHNSQIRHGKFRARQFRNRHGRSILDRRFNISPSRHGRRGSRKFDEGHNRSRFEKRFDPGFGRGFFPTFGSGYRRGDEDSDYESPVDPSGGSEDRPDTTQNLPVTPKWIRVEVLVTAEGSSTGEDSYEESGLGSNCRNGKIEITVNGQPVEAFREDCRRAN